MLAAIQQVVSRYAQVIAKATGIDVEVVDTSFTRIAGTGMYAEGVGLSIMDEGEVYRHAMRMGQSVFMENPREHPLCRRCPKRQACRETLSLCTPIMDGGMVAGIIGLVCFTDTERQKVLSNRETYIDFLDQIAEFISLKLSDQRKLTRVEEFSDLMLQILNVNNRGIIVFNAKGGVSYVNTQARVDLGLTKADPPASLEVKRTGDTLSDLDEFVVTIQGRKTVLVGNLVELVSRDAGFASVLVFDSLPKMTQRMSTFTGQEKLYPAQIILGRSRSIVKLKKLIAQVASSTSTVLITGESGTGKELVARAIHEASDRRDKPFVPINCGAIPDALLESELFGYAGGAFTGASTKGKIGKFELAHRGVIFLDEIGTLPLYLQVKLLRVLQERSFSRLGSNRTIDVDIRIIAATNEDPVELIRQGRFREDLYYRLNVIPMETPPLRDRPEDIDVLAEHFLRKYCALFGKEAALPGTGLLAALKSYPWPGNVREFENAIEFMVNMMHDGGPLHEGLLPGKLRDSLAGRAVTANPHEDATDAPLLSLPELERRAIITALARFRGAANPKRQAATALGISLATLYRKVKEYGVEG